MLPAGKRATKEGDKTKRPHQRGTGVQPAIKKALLGGAGSFFRFYFGVSAAGSVS
jgi:hypothetical protein